MQKTHIDQLTIDDLYTIAHYRIIQDWGMDFEGNEDDNPSCSWYSDEVLENSWYKKIDDECVDTIKEALEDCMIDSGLLATKRIPELKITEIYKVKK